MKKFITHVRVNILHGVLAIIPLVLSLLAIKLIYALVAAPIEDMFHDSFGFSIPGLGILLVLISLYLIGLVASNVLGKQFFGLIERLTRKIPLINTTYQVGKQLQETLSLPEKSLFKEVVLVDFFQPGVWTIGFVTGKVTDTGNHDEELLKVFIPLVPNPTSGFFVVLKSSDTVDPHWSVEEALKMVISGGIISPPTVR